MFFHKISNKEIKDFVASLGFETSDSCIHRCGDINGVNPNGFSFALVDCKQSKLQESLNAKFSSFLRLASICNYGAGISLCFSDFSCYDYLDRFNDYSDKWQEFMFKKFGTTYADELEREFSYTNKPKLKNRNPSNKEK